MSLVDRLLEVDRHDIADYTPFFIEGRRYGWIRPGMDEILRSYPDVFAIDDEHVSLRSELCEYAARTQAFDRVVRDLHERELLMGWWDEPNPVIREWGDEPVMQMERGGLEPFGIGGFGVHLNGFVPHPSGDLLLWVGTRSHDRPSCPGQLDHLAAGGQPLGLGLRENMIKECDEEAGVPAALARRMTLEGRLRYRYAMPSGLNDDTIFCFDLELPPEFEPVNRDGEVESFALWSIEDVIARLRTTRDFKYNVAAVILDFLDRRDLLAGDPEQAGVREILTRMRR